MLRLVHVCIRSLVFIPIPPSIPSVLGIGIAKPCRRPPSHIVALLKDLNVTRILSFSLPQVYHQISLASVRIYEAEPLHLSCRIFSGVFSTTIAISRTFSATDDKLTAEKRGRIIHTSTPPVVRLSHQITLEGSVSRLGLFLSCVLSGSSFYIALITLIRYRRPLQTCFNLHDL